MKMKLGDCATFINGMAFKPSDWEESGLPIIRIQNLTGTSKELNYTNKEIEDKYIIEPGDILVSWSASIGVYKWLGEKAVLNQHIFKVRLDKHNIDKQYFEYLLKSKINEMKRKVHGATMKHITKKKFDEIEVYISPEEEQQRIVKKLDVITDAIEKREKMLNDLEKLELAKFHELFSEEKNIVKLEDVCDKITDGSHNPPKESEEKTEYLMLSSQNIIDNKITQNNARYLTKEDYDKENRRTELKAGDVLLTIVGTVGRSAVITEVDKNLTVQRSVAVLKPNSKVTSNYLNYSIKDSFLNNQIIKKSKGVAQKGIYLKDLKKLNIKVPDITLQNKFDKFIDEIEKQKIIVEKDLVDLNNLLDNKMREFF